MLPLTQIIEDLTYGELFGINLTGSLNGTKGINQEDYPTIIHHINMALTDIYGRFHLKESEILIAQDEGVTEYMLHSKYAQSNGESEAPLKWIVDSEDNPFCDDIIKVLAVYNEVGMQLPLDNYTEPKSLFMANYNTLQIPFPVTGNIIDVVYRAGHVRIDPNVSDISQVDVELPEALREPLLWYVASRAHATRTDQNARALSAEYLNRYEARLDAMKRDGLFQETKEETDIKFAMRGYV